MRQPFLSAHGRPETGPNPPTDPNTSTSETSSKAGDRGERHTARCRCPSCLAGGDVATESEDSKTGPKTRLTTREPLLDCGPQSPIKVAQRAILRRVGGPAR